MRRKFICFYIFLSCLLPVNLIFSSNMEDEISSLNLQYTLRPITDKSFPDQAIQILNIIQNDFASWFIEGDPDNKKVKLQIALEKLEQSPSIIILKNISSRSEPINTVQVSTLQIAWLDAAKYCSLAMLLEGQFNTPQQHTFKLEGLLARLQESKQKLLTSDYELRNLYSKLIHIYSLLLPL